MKTGTSALSLAALLSASLLAGCAPSGAKPAAGPAEPQAAPAAEEAPVVTHHSIELNGKTLNYTATVGRMPMTLDNLAFDMFYYRTG